MLRRFWRLVRWLGRLGWHDPGRPLDPFVGTPARLKRGPKDRHGGIALSEPDDE